MTEQESEQYEEKLIEHLQKLEENFGYFELRVGFGEVVLVISHLQLAIRHPAIDEATRKAVRDITERIIGALDKAEPGVGALLNMGFNPEHDTEPLNERQTQEVSLLQQTGEVSLRSQDHERGLPRHQHNVRPPNV